MSHPTQEDLVLLHYHDADAETAEHVMACEECRTELEAIRRVLAAVDAAEIPEPDEGWEDGQWNRLRWRLGSSRRRVSWWAIGSVAAVLLVVAFLGGRLSQRAQAPATAPVPLAAASSDVARNRVFFVVVGDHLDRTKRVLLELANQSDNGDLGAEQRQAADLVQSNRLYRQTAVRSGDTNLADLLRQLEPVLIEIAHSPSNPTPRELDSLRKRIESKGLLFKLRVVGDDVRMKESPKAPAAGHELKL